MTKSDSTDVFIKDEGEFCTIIFQSEAAKVAADKDSSIKKLMYGNQFYKMDIPNEGIPAIRTWAKQLGLTVYSEVDW